jgi:hypothetical protein
MIKIIYILSLLPLLASASELDIDKLAGDYLCFGGGMDFKHKLASEYYVYEEFIQAHPKCNPAINSGNEGANFNQAHQKILGFSKL